MDPDGLGVLLLPNVIASLFPEAAQQGSGGDPVNFVVYHHNGIARPGSGVHFVRGVAKTTAPKDFGSTPILQAMRTKWSELEVEWAEPPSIS